MASAVLSKQSSYHHDLQHTFHPRALDLAGEGYAWGWPDPARRDPSDWAGRWAGEQQLLERTMRVHERTGVELERAGCA